MRAIYEKELRSSFCSVTGFLFAAFVLLFTGIYCMAINLSGGYPNFEYTLSNMTFIFLVAIPVLTMRSVAEERRQRTDQLLYSLPLSMTKVVLGKYFAMLTVVALPFAVMALYPLVLALYGSVNLLSAYGNLLAFFLLAASLVAVGMFMSALAENQVIAAVLTFVSLLVLFFLGDLATYIPTTAAASYLALAAMAALLSLLLLYLTKSFPVAAIALVVLEVGMGAVFYVKPSLLEGLVPELLGGLSVFDRYSAFVGQIFDLTGIVYFISFSAVFLFLTVQALEKRRWS